MAPHGSARRSTPPARAVRAEGDPLLRTVCAHCGASCRMIGSATSSITICAFAERSLMIFLGIAG